MIDFIERLRAKPEHVRKHIAFFAASSITGLVALMWFGAFVSSGALSRSAPSQTNAVTAAFTEHEGASLLGAIGALTTREDGSIQVVETTASSTAGSKEAPEERTTIPF